MPKSITFVVAAAFFLVAVVGNSSAAVPQDPQGAATYYSAAGHAPGEPISVIEAQHKHFKAFLHSRTLSSTSKACTQHPWYQKYEFKNPYGVLLIGYYMQVYYCRANGQVTYFYRYRWSKVSSLVPFVHWTPWEFAGNQPSGNDCGNEHCFIRGYKAPNRTAVTLGEFKTCLIPIINAGCNYLYPRLWITVHGDGSKPDSGWSD